MPNRPKSICRHQGCSELIDKPGYCLVHEKQFRKLMDARRGTAHERGYDSKWQKYSKWFLNQPENQFCVIQLPGCTEFAKCVDHIKPCDKDDPLFWDKSNHQPACIHCNSVKGRRELRGER